MYESLNVLDAKLVCATGFCSSFNSARIMKDKICSGTLFCLVNDEIVTVGCYQSANGGRRLLP